MCRCLITKHGEGRTCDCPCHKAVSHRVCGIAYCNSIATYQVEIRGFFKQFMCDQHSESMADAVSPSYWYGKELLS